MESIKQVIMRRDGLSAAEADDQIAAARERVAEGEDPQDVLEEEFAMALVLL